jgi:hypothetical protein
MLPGSAMTGVAAKTAAGHGLMNNASLVMPFAPMPGVPGGPGTGGYPQMPGSVPEKDEKWWEKFMEKMEGGFNVQVKQPQGGGGGMYPYGGGTQGNITKIGRAGRAPTGPVQKTQMSPLQVFFKKR